jgi:hypothetical protein
MMKPAMIRSNVVLPDPDGPSSEVNDPSGKLVVISSRTDTEP